MIQIPENIDSKYRFVILAALRARQLQGGYPPKIMETGSRKSTQLAQHEVLKNLVEFRFKGEKKEEVAPTTEE